MKTFLDWSSYKDAGLGDAYADIPRVGGDFARAVSVCINSRQCETVNKGVMCPSYRVSAQEKLSTGGRIRLLKSALNADETASALANADLSKAMDVCVACKACKRECENEVDMAMLKIEYLAQRYQYEKPKIRTRLIANLSAFLQFFTLFRSLTRLRNRYNWLKVLGERFLGISAARHLPEPAKHNFGASSDNRPTPTIAGKPNEQVVGEVALFLDTFSNNYRPENVEAAIRVLDTAGYRVFIVESETKQALCCGRSQLANGLVEAAKHNARRTLAALLPHVEAGRFIIGLEPACLLAIRDDYKFLGLGEPAVKVASRALLFEEFVAKEKQAKRFDVSFKPLDLNQPVLVHGHCHQKAVGAMKSMRKILKLIPQLQYEFIESSCCGMAGSFGIEKEHAKLSMQMAEDALLPALRANPHSRVLANGFACQHQIMDA